MEEYVMLYKKLNHNRKLELTYYSNIYNRQLNLVKNTRYLNFKHKQPFLLRLNNNYKQLVATIEHNYIKRLETSRNTYFAKYHNLYDSIYDTTFVIGNNECVFI